MSDAISIPGGPEFSGQVNGTPTPSFAFTVPYRRTSPVHVPRRDLVLGSADSLFLRITIVDSDSVDALALDLTGGLGGPALQMVVWPDTYYRTSWDYGARPHCPPPPIWIGTGVPSDAVGAFDIAFPPGTSSSWPRRCRYALQLDWEGGGETALLVEGGLHLTRSVARSGIAPVIMLTDPSPPVLMDDSGAVVLLNGSLS